MTQNDPHSSVFAGVALLHAQRAAQNHEGTPSARLRMDRLSRAIDLLVTHKSDYQQALSADFGHRSPDFTAFADVATSINALRHARKHVKSWMRPSRRALEFPLGLTGASGRIEYQPKGVVGIMAPWNFPLNLMFVPLAGALAAGNRVLMKPSEFTPETSALTARLIAQSFAPQEVSVITGDAATGAAFSALALDHLVFTGSTAVGRHVMRAAAENLVPVTLELGGKSPVIIGASADLQMAATRIMHGKIFNAGQICIAPDYVLLSKDQQAKFAAAAEKAVDQMFPSGLRDNPDYTSILNQAHYDRMQDYLRDARDKGANIVELNPKSEDFAQQPHHKLPPTLILGATDDMAVMQQEIFGPLLPVRDCPDTAAAIQYVNAHPRPLALYFFGRSRREEHDVLSQTVSGGVTVNDTIMHISQDNLPFGGVGPSGMGHYHGKDGFREFSHQKAVFRQMQPDLLRFLRPPYGRAFRAYLKTLVKR
ncbi:coniferyl aldehyde dehydrogenase [Rhodobacteraceae bacterium M382]|nr:coniferyl aldehyde dehydrogenase [Rhodobacteraceae bacterium M382]